jgi:hypothetical protein
MCLTQHSCSWKFHGCLSRKWHCALGFCVVTRHQLTLVTEVPAGTRDCWVTVDPCFMPSCHPLSLTAAERSASRTLNSASDENPRANSAHAVSRQEARSSPSGIQHLQLSALCMMDLQRSVRDPSICSALVSSSLDNVETSVPGHAPGLR